MGFIAASIASFAAIKAMFGVVVALGVTNVGLTSYIRWQEPIDNFFTGPFKDFFTGPVKDFFTGKYFRREEETNNDEKDFDGPKHK